METVSQPRMGLRQWNEAGKNQPRNGAKDLSPALQRWVKWKVRPVRLSAANAALNEALLSTGTRRATLERFSNTIMRFTQVSG